MRSYPFPEEEEEKSSKKDRESMDEESKERKRERAEAERSLSVRLTSTTRIHQGRAPSNLRELESKRNCWQVKRQQSVRGWTSLRLPSTLLWYLMK